MRSDLIIAAAASALLASAESITCGRSASQDLAYYVSCGDKDAISQCFQNGHKLVDLADIATCLTEGGCSKSDALVEAAWIASVCDSSESWANGELRKRATTDDATTSTSKDTTSTSESTSNAKRTTTTDATTTDSSSTTTTSASSTSSTQTSTTASSTTSSTSSSTGTSSITSSTITSSSSSATVSTNSCFSTSSKTTSVCVTTGGTSSCSATVSTASKCFSTKVCTTDTSGSDVCMDRQDDLTTSGLIVTIGFAIFIVAFFTSLVIMSAKESRERKADKAAAEALLGGDMKHN